MLPAFTHSAIGICHDDRDVGRGRLTATEVEKSMFNKGDKVLMTIGEGHYGWTDTRVLECEVIKMSKSGKRVYVKVPLPSDTLVKPSNRFTSAYFDPSRFTIKP